MRQQLLTRMAEADDDSTDIRGAESEGGVLSCGRRDLSCVLVCLPSRIGSRLMKKYFGRCLSL